MENTLSKAERTRQFIIETTAGIFNTKGYAGTSMSDITEATGLTKGSIYGNFENKEDVALAVFDYNYSRLTKIRSQKVAQAVTYHDKLMVYTQIYHSFNNKTFPDGGCPILNTAVEADDTNPRLKDKAAKAIFKWKKNIMDLVQEGIDSGEFKPVDDIEQMALSMIALIEGGIMIAKVTANPLSLDKVLKNVEALINQIKA
jgi:TetR/AcrR family transcriptional repressor of nem operon